MVLLTISDIVFKVSESGIQYAEIVVSGKTKSRTLPLINSFPYLKDWLENHPAGGNPNSWLFVSLSKNNFLAKLSCDALLAQYQYRYKKNFFPALLENDTVPPRDKGLIRNMLTKPFSLYVFRHSALTEKSQLLKESTLRDHAWLIKYFYSAANTKSNNGSDSGMDRWLVYTKYNSVCRDKYNGDDFVTAFDCFFRRPRLYIEHNESEEPNVFAPAHEFVSSGPVQRFFRQKYLRVRVYNKGRTTARNCRARLHVLPTGNNPSLYPSTDPKRLTWGRSPDKSDLSTEIDIHPFKDDELLHVIFSDSSFADSIVGSIAGRFAEVSTFQNLQPTPTILRVEDSFAHGDFLAELTVTSEDAHAKAKLRIHVERDFLSIRIRKLSRYNNFVFNVRMIKRAFLGK